MIARVLIVSLQLAAGLTLSGRLAAGQHRSPLAQISMFDEPSKAFEMPSPITRSGAARAARTAKTGSVVVTDGSGSFLQSRSMFQQLHDFGDFGKIVASSASIPEAKKMLMTRTARYSGLLDVLEFHEGASPTFDGVAAWLALNADEETLPADIEAACKAGVTRAFVLCSTPLSDFDAMDAKLAASGLEYTLMRTGALVADEAAVGLGLKLDDFEGVTCEDVPMGDVFRFVTESLTLPEAAKRSFSLCPSTGTAPALKQMRLAGYDRRDEVRALLLDALPDGEAEAAAKLSPEAAAEQEQLVLRSEAEVAAEREEELKMLLARARQRGEETQARLQHEEAERLAYRKEQEKYYKAPSSDADADDDAPPTAPPADETTRDASPPADAA